MAAITEKNKSARGATAVTIGWRVILRAWLQHHQASARDSFFRQLRAPFQHILTAAVIGVTLALPALFALALGNFQQLGEQWHGNPRLSIFLERKTEANDIAALQKQLQQNSAVTAVTLTTPEQGLASFEKSAHLSNTLTLLDENPLPPLLTVELRADTTPETVQQLQTQWQPMPHVDSVQADFAWLKKLFHIMQLGERIAWGLAILLVIGALLSVGNTVRLALENRCTEIIVAKLVGATDAFVRRPFLYSGFWFGFSGGCMAIFLVIAGYYSVIAPVTALAALYQSNFVLQGPALFTALGLLLAGIAIGVIGAWLTVGNHLREMRPQ
jgi:cell division transport system permease protein